MKESSRWSPGPAVEKICDALFEPTDKIYQLIIRTQDTEWTHQLRMSHEQLRDNR